MPRIIRHIHEYYDNRIVNGLYCRIINDGAALEISAGSAVIDKALVSLAAPVVLAFNTNFVVEGNRERRTDLVVLDTTGTINVLKGTPGTCLAPKIPELSILIAQITLPPGWKRFVGAGAEDEVMSIRSQHVIDTRFLP